MNILLDTNAYSEMRRGHRGVAETIRRSDGVLMSTIVIGELIHGFRRGTRYRQNIDELRGFLSEAEVDVVPVSIDTSNRFGRVAAELADRGTPIPTNDVWIAAHAFETGAELVTFDGHFSRVSGLAWVSPAA